LGEDGVSLRQQLQRRGAQLLSDPRVFKLLQSERLVRALTAALCLPEKLGGSSADWRERFAGMLELPSMRQFAELERRVSSLEGRLDRESDGQDSR
jgi:cell division FtsZ-interacting protein ZapD